MKKRLMIVDISSFIFRAFFAIRPLHAPDKTPVNAVYGVLSMLMKIFQVYKPTHVLLAKETKGGSFRNEMYPEYKANRSEPPEDLVPQFDLIEQLTQKLQVPFAVDDQFEADDIIGSACVKWRDDFDEILIASGDKDLMQFVNGKVRMVDTMKDKIYDPDEVFAKMGVHPHQIVDYLSLVGDSSDNIPGMKGVGAKGAAALLEEYGTLDECIKNKDKLKGKRLQNAFENHLEEALLSRELVKIVTDIDLKIEPEQTAYQLQSSDDLIEFLEQLGFNRIVKKIQELGTPEKKEKKKKSESDQSAPISLNIETVANKEKVDIELELVQDEKTLSEFLKQLDQHKEVAVYNLYTNEEDIFARRVALMGVAFAKKSFVFSFKHNKLSNFRKKQLFQILEKTWADKEKKVISFDIKKDMTHAVTIGANFDSAYFDLTQAHFVSEPSMKHDMPSIIFDVTGIELPSLERKEDLLEADEKRVLDVVGKRASSLIDACQILEQRMKEKEVDHIYRDIDAPLIPVLARMEREGIAIDPKFFSVFEKELQKKLDDIQGRVNDCGHGEVNLNSPKQVGELLFETLGLPTIKKTKTGFSTDSEVLEQLDQTGESEVPSLILQYREIGKILSTYVKALPELISPTSHRVHTSFNQHIAQTGRLSSTHPNLQNIPIRSELGRRVRKGFVADRGNILLGADYSQVELRILAHFSQDPTMIAAFKDGVDIHAQTASEVLGVALDQVSANDRSKAKAVNFGLMYGQSSFGLAKALGISRKEAKDYIDRYFARFKKVKAYLDELKEFANQTGYSVTMHGRKRFLPDIHSQNRTIKANAERVAINSPIQGTAADILKMAMLNIAAQIKEKNLQAKMLLQVHDELIFELPESEAEQLEKLVVEGMESVVELAVPLTVEVGTATNWYDLK